MACKKSQLDGLYLVDGKPIIIESKAATSDNIYDALRAVDENGIPTRDSEWYANNMFKPVESLFGNVKPEYTMLHPEDVIVKGTKKEPTKIEAEFLQKFTDAGYISTSDHYRMGLNRPYVEKVGEEYINQEITIEQQARTIYNNWGE